MAARADPAYFGDDGGKFLHGASFTELFKSPEFRDLEIDILDFSFFIQEDFDFSVSFQSRNRVNGDSGHSNFFPNMDKGKLKR